MWRKLSFADQETVGTSYANGALNLTKDQEIALNLGYQAILRKDPTQGGGSVLLGESNTIDVVMYMGALSTTVWFAVTTLSLITFF